MSVYEKMTAIADNIREKTGGTEALSLDDMASGVNDVYEAGKQAEYDAFWDVYQERGARGNYKFAFGGHGWTSNTFRPKYSMRPTNAQSMFQETVNNYIEWDLVAILEECGVSIDFSKVTSSNFNNTFFSTYSTTVPLVDTTSANSSSISNTFNSAHIKKIYGLRLKDNGSQTFTSAFTDCSKLEEITITGGVIGQNISFAKSPLTVESMKSVITHLKNYAGTDKEFTYKVTFSSACLTALEAEGATSPNGNNWLDYMTDLGWNH